MLKDLFTNNTKFLGIFIQGPKCKNDINLIENNLGLRKFNEGKMGNFGNQILINNPPLPIRNMRIISKFLGPALF